MVLSVLLGVSTGGLEKGHLGYLNFNVSEVWCPIHKKTQRMPNALINPGLPPAPHPTVQSIFFLGGGEVIKHDFNLQSVYSTPAVLISSCVRGFEPCSVASLQSKRC